MKTKKWHLEILAFLAMYIFAIYLWTLPFQDNKIPYGEFDAISHWELADSFAGLDKTYVSLPLFVDYSYGGQNRFKPHTLWYHPPFHTDLAMVESIASYLTGERMVPVYLTNAIFASSILISVYFVMRKLFGFLSAILSEFLLAFSMRDIMPYLWGQWPERFGYAFVPLILYCFYSYCINYSKDKAADNKNSLHLLIMAILLAVQMMIHPLSFFHSLAAIFVLFIALAIKMRKIPFNAKHIAAAALIFAVIFAAFPYQSGNVAVSLMQKTKKTPDNFSVSRLFEWGPNPKYFEGSVPPSYFSFKAMHGAWTLPFLLIGLLILLIRRENRDLFLLAWLISLYLILHRDAFDKWKFLHRSLSATAHIFVPITVIGAVSLFSIFKTNSTLKAVLKYAGALAVIILAVNYNMPQAYSTLNTAYDDSIMRLNSAQIEANEWVEKNVPVGKNVSVAGLPLEIMQKAWWMASVSHRVTDPFEGYLKWGTYKDNREQVVTNVLLNNYIMFD